MDLRNLTSQLSVAPQIGVEDVAILAANGFRTVICNRPDAENPAELHSGSMAQAAAAAGLSFRYLPIEPGSFNPDQIARFGELIADAEGPVLAYCRSGTRSATAWALSQRERLPADEILRCTANAGYDLSGLLPYLG